MIDVSKGMRSKIVPTKISPTAAMVVVIVRLGYITMQRAVISSVVEFLYDAEIRYCFSFRHMPIAIPKCQEFRCSHH